MERSTTKGIWDTPSNHRIVKNEEEKAKSLMQMTMARASGMDVDADTIANIYQSGCVEVGDLHWISNAMGISVRCTISDEARNRVLGCGGGDGSHFKFEIRIDYIYTYIIKK